MNPRTSAARGNRLPVGSRSVLLAAVLAVMVALTVLSMHSLHLHAGTASPQASHASGASAAGDAAPAAGHHAAGHHAAGHHAAGHHAAGHDGAASAVAGADVGMQEHDGGAAGDASCATCPADHLGLAMTCLVALLLVLARVVRPGARVLSTGHGVRAGPAPGLVHRILLRPPSLTVLCISRT